MELRAQTSPRTVIVAATDGSAASREAMAAAARFSALPGAELHVIYVLDPGEASRRAEAMGEAEVLLREEAQMFGLNAALHLAVGTPASEIVQLAAELEADVVVVGTHDRSGIQRVILGSVAEQVVKNARCPVFVARPKRHEKSEAKAPAIEPPCPKCLAVQQETAGARMWCDQHAEHHARGRAHYSMPPGFGVGSNLIRPS